MNPETPAPVTRAKFALRSITDYGGQSAKRCTFSAVGADEIPENQRYHKYTPVGEMTISIDNPVVIEKLEIGKSYYLDFTPAD